MKHKTQLLAVPILCLAYFLLNGCASMISSATGELAENLSASMLDQNDPELVASAVPAYLLLIDAMLRSDPDSVSLLTGGAKLYTAYGIMFADDPQRSKKLSQRGFSYANRAVCSYDKKACGIISWKFERFEHHLTTLTKKDVPVYYTLGTTWAARIQSHSDDWNAIANLAQVTALMNRLIELDDTYDDGGAHVYLGILATLIPPAAGGKPETGKKHFERAIEITQGRNLMVKLYFAKHYARLVFDQPLHDRLLQQVIDADPNQEGFTLTNVIAQQEARKLLAESKEFF